MIGKTLALTLRSIREDTRLLRTHLFRLMLLLIVFWFLYLTQSDELGYGAPGLEFFHSIVWLNFAFISMAGIGFFASAITEEKEEMTLGLLRMAGIGPMALLAGKLLPRLLGAILQLAVQYPFTLLAITLGGVTVDQVSAAYYTLASYTMLLAAIALFFSVSCQVTRTAAFLTTVSVALFLFIPWWILNVVGWTATSAFGMQVHPVVSLLRDASPMVRISEIMDTGFLQTPKYLLTGKQDSAFGFQAKSNLGAAAGFLFLSWLTFGWFNRDERSSTPARGLILKSSSKLRRWTGGRAWNNALFWKDLQFIAGGPMLLLIKTGLYFLAAIALAVSVPWMNWNGGFDWDMYGGMTITFAIIMFCIEATLLASNVFRQEVKWKTWPSLVMLPTSLLKIAYSKVAGCLFGLLPAFGWFLFGALCVPDEFTEAMNDVVDEPGFWFMLTHFVLLLHLAAFLSLFVKWMAFPLSIGILVMFNTCCIWTMSEMGNGGDEGIFVVMIFLGGFAAFVLHLGIGVRLNSLATQ